MASGLHKACDGLICGPWIPPWLLLPHFSDYSRTNGCSLSRPLFSAPAPACGATWSVAVKPTVQGPGERPAYQRHCAEEHSTPILSNSVQHIFRGARGHLCVAQYSTVEWETSACTVMDGRRGSHMAHDPGGTWPMILWSMQFVPSAAYQSCSRPLNQKLNIRFKNLKFATKLYFIQVVFMYQHKVSVSGNRGSPDYK